VITLSIPPCHHPCDTHSPHTFQTQLQHQTGCGSSPNTLLSKARFTLDTCKVTVCVVHQQWPPWIRRVGTRSEIWNLEQEKFHHVHNVLYYISSTGLVPRHSKIGEECLVSTVHGCVAPRVSLGNLETIVILVRVARHCITESRESLHLDAALFI